MFSSNRGHVESSPTCPRHRGRRGPRSPHGAGRAARGPVCTLPAGGRPGGPTGVSGRRGDGPFDAAYEPQSEMHVGFLLFPIVSSLERLKTSLETARTSGGRRGTRTCLNKAVAVSLGTLPPTESGRAGGAGGQGRWPRRASSEDTGGVVPAPSPQPRGERPLPAWGPDGVPAVLAQPPGEQASLDSCSQR